MSIRMTKKRRLAFSGKQTDRLIYLIYFLLFINIIYEFFINFAVIFSN